MEKDNTRLMESLKGIREGIQSLTRELNGIIARECPELEMIRITNEVSDLRKEWLEDRMRRIERKEIRRPDYTLFSLYLFKAYRYGLTLEELKPIAKRARYDADILYGHYLSLCHRRCTGESVSLETIMGRYSKEAQLLMKPVGSLPVSVRLYNYLHAWGIETVGDIVSHSRAEFMKLRGCGRKILYELDSLVEGLGLSYKGDSAMGNRERPTAASLERTGEIEISNRM